MLLVQAGCLFLTLLLHLSGILGLPNDICALKGSSVDLPCSITHPTSRMRWFTEHWNGTKFVPRELSADGNHVMYDTSQGSDSTLQINHLRESDQKTYCCREATDNPECNWLSGIILRVTDLQVKVTPVTATEGQRVTLTCSTSCPLTENPAVYIWYKNGSFVYQDSSPWYQDLVSSEEAVSYSCAVKGYEDLRAPEVSVDSVTSTCFSVTYAGGRMCSSNQRCSITFPRDIHVEVIPAATYGSSVTLTCKTSCVLSEHKLGYSWYENGYYRSYNHQINVPSSSADNYYCAVGDHEDVHSPAVCAEGKNCWSVNYVSRRICAVEGSSVDISCDYSYPSGQMVKPTFWYKIKSELKTGGTNTEILSKDPPRVEYHDNMENHHILRIKNLTKSDSAEYRFRFHSDKGELKYSDFPGVTLTVTGLNVMVTPSAVVTEGQRVTLTCSTSCPLTDNTAYIWYHNRRPLTPAESRHKQLLLDPVSAHHAGNYSCAVQTHQNITSPEDTLTVRGAWTSWLSAAAAGTTTLLLVIITLSIFLWIRKQKTTTQTLGCGAPGDMEQLNCGPVHGNISAVSQRPIPAAQSKTTEQDDLHYSSVHFSKKSPLYSTIQPHQPQRQEEVHYATVNFSRGNNTSRLSRYTVDPYCTAHKIPRV